MSVLISTKKATWQGINCCKLGLFWYCYNYQNEKIFGKSRQI